MLKNFDILYALKILSAYVLFIKILFFFFLISEIALKYVLSNTLLLSPLFLFFSIFSKLLSFLTVLKPIITLYTNPRCSRYISDMISSPFNKHLFTILFIYKTDVDSFIRSYTSFFISFTRFSQSSKKAKLSESGIF